MEKAGKSTLNWVFWAHLALVAAGWLGPFLFDWRLMLTGYAIIMLQFLVIGSCVLNAQHGVDDTKEDYTFYAELFEKMGYQPDRKRLKKVVRTWLYLALGAFTLVWQLVLGMKPLFS